MSQFDNTGIVNDTVTSFHPCPTCGRCPTCGHGTRVTPPLYTMPYWDWPTITYTIAMPTNTVA